MLPGFSFRLTLALAVVLAALSALGLASSVGGARSTSEPSGQIAFTRADGIYVMRADGSGVRRIRRTGTAFGVARLAWSPDGRKLAFEAEDGIWVMNADGSGLGRLVWRGGHPLSPTWSPDGRWIAFTASSSAGRDIWIANVNGWDERRLARTPRLLEVEVDWSPAGGRIALSTASGWIPNVYVMNTNGSNLRNLTPGRFDGLEPAWSPDGRRLAFRRWQGSSGSDEIYVVNADGTNRLQLTSNDVADREPSWSPDGSRITFVRRAAGHASDEIYVINTDGTGETRLTYGEGSPAWQPVAAP